MTLQVLLIKVDLQWFMKKFTLKHVGKLMNSNINRIKLNTTKQSGASMHLITLVQALFLPLKNN